MTETVQKPVEPTYPAEVLAFIGNLKALDRGGRAKLRRNAGKSIAEARAATGLFYSQLPAERRIHEEVYFLVATLFDPDASSDSGDFGTTMRQLRAARESDSLDRRMAILLDSQFVAAEGGGELAYRLRQLVKLAIGQGLGINWPQLLLDLSLWSFPEKRVQKRWARSYFSPSATEGAEPEGGRASHAH